MTATTAMTAQVETPAGASTAPRPTGALRRWRWAAVLTLATAGFLHISAAAEHVGAGELTVGFFLLTAFAQLGFAVWLAVGGWAGSAPARELLTLGLIGTVGLLGLYVLAYTTNLLDVFAVPHDGGAGHASAGGVDHAGEATTSHVDPATGVDLTDGMSVRSNGSVAMAAEATAVQHAPGALGTATATAEVLALAALAALLPDSWRRRATNALLGLGGLAWALWLTGVLA